jgi:hypothetical protein
MDMEIMIWLDIEIWTTGRHTTLSLNTRHKVEVLRLKSLDANATPESHQSRGVLKQIIYFY